MEIKVKDTSGDVYFNANGNNRLNRRKPFKLWHSNNIAVVSKQCKKAGGTSSGVYGYYDKDGNMIYQTL